MNSAMMCALTARSDMSVNMRRLSAHLVSLGRCVASSCKCKRQRLSVSIGTLYRRPKGDNPPYPGEEQRGANRSVSLSAIQRSRYRPCGVPRQTGGRRLALPISEMGHVTTRFLRRKSQHRDRVKREPTGGDRPLIGIAHSHLLEGKY
jgi:hypothetical protein